MKIGSACAKMLLNGLIIFIVTILFFPGEIWGKEDQNKNDYRLSNNAIPWHYKIDILPINIENTAQSFYYVGSCNIFFFVLHSTKNITLHLNKVKIKMAEVNDYFTDSQLPNFWHNYAKGTINFNFTRELSPGIHVLRILFNGTATDNEHIFFRTTYKTEDYTV